MKQGILNFYRTEIKRNRLPHISKKVTDSEIKEELKLIHALRSNKSAMQRKAIIKEAEKRGIAI